MNERERLAAPEHARNIEYQKALEHSNKTGKCIFCDPLGPQNVTLKVGKFWRCWWNPIPYKHLEGRHFIIASIKHAKDLSELESGAGDELLELVNWAKSEFPILQHVGIVIRNGNVEGTISHLHVHLQAPDGIHTCIAVFGKGQNWPQIQKLLDEEP
ncbi:MAG: hypothetical protein A3H57_04765 [Candidatus Taylorbacteria bacterium RIFCSPLOWO2_02_FULL_43_11]|uniref:HIT domain-containing protein n=1 Tax=Candidatus Taylorbacteria bacterium RIFCSPHIGHO2_02_FULL_43_32b TaxID=1802306 RepID=A0A1G2MKQ3_9BACT|nr:MAG: hypothetical protein A2743_03865 [Candidatus Taylorbacteria bacterium RIFCSPHIGHO2_01_FULL_43_47]OHA24428.1 MAG: hypothetical protein A3C72_01930 [Candidatus Taylorbacteria bacterium RIFCSPHIGHO2_02_FULL_43_32b]OHA31556.1 MAG: hypothetical protein A3B08_04425 [Candidatus Taylorbacteria bacterium RIFCSPLOWO2_01_FULL_43_44]OHA35323.1 MAG: hypothetical protein A3H57_04765 [Candidatus Taylorbacteria bacterium RIFCSPLOWO2_02_FULL_43_11]